jgi:uncharacterized protein
MSDGINFEWDEEKNKINIQKHGLSFEQAKALWDDDFGLKLDLNFPDEDRFTVIGKIDDKIWTAIVTMRGNHVRIISVRRARDIEVQVYEG